MLKDECGNCVFYRDENHRGTYMSGYGVCRRYPTPVKTNDGEWCGEHKRISEEDTTP